jgi:hypothetical protein
VFLLVILIIHIAIGIVVFVKRDGDAWEKKVNSSITDIFTKYPQVGRDEVDSLQRDVSQCCMLKKIWAIFFSTYKGYPVQLLA